MVVGLWEEARARQDLPLADGGGARWATSSELPALTPHDLMAAGHGKGDTARRAAVDLYTRPVRGPGPGSDIPGRSSSSSGGGGGRGGGEDCEDLRGFREDREHDDKVQLRVRGAKPLSGSRRAIRGLPKAVRAPAGAMTP